MALLQYVNLKLFIMELLHIELSSNVFKISV